MSLHGEIKVNHHVIGEWVAVRVGEHGQCYIYKCHGWYTDTQGYCEKRRYFVLHRETNGALVLSSAVIQSLQSAIKMETRQKSWEDAWLDFCANYGVDYDSLYKL